MGFTQVSLLQYVAPLMREVVVEAMLDLTSGGGTWLNFGLRRADRVVRPSPLNIQFWENDIPLNIQFRAKTFEYRFDQFRATNYPWNNIVFDTQKSNHVFKST